MKARVTALLVAPGGVAATTSADERLREASVELVGHQTRPATNARERLYASTTRVLVVDVLAGTIASGAGVIARFGLPKGQIGGVDYRILAAALVPAWLIALLLSGSYGRRVATMGAEQYWRVLNAGAWLLAVVALVSFGLKSDISRGFIILSIALAVLLTVAGRVMARAALHRRFASGRSAHAVVVIGSPVEITDLVSHLHRTNDGGFRVVAAITPNQLTEAQLPAGIRWIGADTSAVVSQAQILGADTLLVADPHVLEGGGLRRLSWALEGTNISLLVAPAMTDVAGPRIRVRPIDGLPLMEVESAHFTGPKRALKGVIDRIAALVLLVAFAPIMAAVAIAVRLDSPGPVFFRQLRAGLNGEQFAVLKFRTMRSTAQIPTETLAMLNESSGLLFKIRSDPRVTRVGRFLRRFSLDEIPQLWNVVNGDMSLVGPRPLPVDADHLAFDMRRRLLVKPGMTGLWQVSGRSDLSWDETVRLDLFYIDNWSVRLDVILLWKTFATVLHGRGAY